jgi:hypothetical protein
MSIVRVYKVVTPSASTTLVVLNKVAVKILELWLFISFKVFNVKTLGWYAYISLKEYSTKIHNYILQYKIKVKCMFLLCSIQNDRIIGVSDNKTMTKDV